MKNVTKVITLSLQNSLILFTLLFTGLTLQAQTTTFTEQQKVASDARDSYDGYSYQVDIDKDFAVVSEIYDNLDENEMNYVNRAGKINVLKKVNGQWQNIQKIVSTTRSSFDNFGWDVAISGDYIFASRPFALTNQGEVYVYKRDGGDADNFSLVQILQASTPKDNSFFGVALDVNGDYAVISARREQEDASGGNPLTEAGAAYVFQNIAGTWTEVRRMISPNRATNNEFGIGVAIDGDNLVIGEWRYDPAGHIDTGAAYVYNKDTGGTNAWGLVTQLAPSPLVSYIRFGEDVDISGDNIVVGALNDDTGGGISSDFGAAYVYNKNTGGANTWGQVKVLTATVPETDDEFASEVAIDGDYILIGVKSEDHDVNDTNMLNNSGSAYFYKRNNGGANNWGLMQKVTAGVRDENDKFGSAVALDGCTAIIGSLENSTDANNGNYNPSGPGAVYFFGDELYSELAVTTPATCTVDAIITATNSTAVNYEFFVDANANRQWDTGETVQNGAGTTYTATGLSATDEVGVIVTNAAGERCETIVDILKECVEIFPKVNLVGALLSSPTAGEMNTALAQNSLIPTAQPYTAGAGYAHVGAGGTETTTMAVLNDASLGVVDWVFVELRDAAGTTVLQTASALLLKNGNVVGTDGVSPVQFPAPSGMYHVAVHHRNHLGVMTGAPMSL